MTAVRPAWGDLSQAAEALQAVCARVSCSAQPAIDSLAVHRPTSRWQQNLPTRGWRRMHLFCVPLPRRSIIEPVLRR